MTAIMHFTHVSHLSAIVAAGGLYCDRVAAEKKVNTVNIAHLSLKADRALTHVPVASGGTLADYVPHYFAPRSPMLYAIRMGGVADYAGGQKEIVYLVSSAEAVAAAGLSFAFTDGHGVVAFTDFFDDLERLDEVDWPLMEETYWTDTLEDNDRKRRRQAEFLVHSFLPWELVEKIVVKDDARKGEVLAAIASSSHQPPVVVDHGYYF